MTTPNDMIDRTELIKGLEDGLLYDPSFGEGELAVDGRTAVKMVITFIKDF